MSDIELLIKTLLHQARLHSKQGANGLGLLFTNASQELEKLQAENAELKMQSQWISVDNPPTVAESGNWVAVPVLCEDGYVRVYDFNVKSKKWMHGLDKVISKPVKWMSTAPEGE